MYHISLWQSPNLEQWNWILLNENTKHTESGNAPSEEKALEDIRRTIKWLEHGSTK